MTTANDHMEAAIARVEGERNTMVNEDKNSSEGREGTVTPLIVIPKDRLLSAGQGAAFFCHWLARAYEAESRDTSYEEGESLREVMRQINQVLGFAGYEPESSARTDLLKRDFHYADTPQVVGQSIIDAEIVKRAIEHVWEPENWESYERCRNTRSFSLPVEWFELCRVIEESYGSMPLEEPCDCGAKTVADHKLDCEEKPDWEQEGIDCRARRFDAVVDAAVEWHQSGREDDGTWLDKAGVLEDAINALLELREQPSSGKVASPETLNDENALVPETESVSLPTEQGKEPAKVCTCFATPDSEHSTYCPREGMDFDAPVEQGKLTAEEQLLREAVLRVIDDKRYGLWAHPSQYVANAGLEARINRERLDFADAVIACWKRFKVQG